MATIQAQEIWLQGTKYYLLEGGSIVPTNWRGEIGYAHLCEDDIVRRYHQEIARKKDIVFGERVAMPFTVDHIGNIFESILDW